MGKNAALKTKYKNLADEHENSSDLVEMYREDESKHKRRITDLETEFNTFKRAGPSGIDESEYKRRITDLEAELRELKRAGLAGVDAMEKAAGGDIKRLTVELQKHEFESDRNAKEILRLKMLFEAKEAEVKTLVDAVQNRDEALNKQDADSIGDPAELGGPGPSSGSVVHGGGCKSDGRKRAPSGTGRPVPSYHQHQSPANERESRHGKW